MKFCHCTLWMTNPDECLNCENNDDFETVEFPEDDFIGEEDE
ncbi:MAG TPA: hypothetical protein PLW61_04780 [Caldisericia bacterium]|nr:hypothetical protein [Caldisericia bacterium]